MRKIIVALGVVASGMVGIFAVAGRGTHELKGFVRASADRAADGVTESLSEEIHDRKIDQEMKQVRLDLIDQQVQMNLSSRKIEELTGSIERRQRLLAEAYPILILMPVATFARTWATSRNPHVLANVATTDFGLETECLCHRQEDEFAPMRLNLRYKHRVEHHDDDDNRSNWGFVIGRIITSIGSSIPSTVITTLTGRTSKTPTPWPAKAAES